MPITKPNFDKPIIYGDIDRWGGKLNKIIDQIEVFNTDVVQTTSGLEIEVARLDKDKIGIDEADKIIESKVDNYIGLTVKPDLDDYVENLKLTNIKPFVEAQKVELNEHNEQKKIELNTYVEKTNKPNLDAYVETKKVELNEHTNVKKTELNTHTNTKKSELDTYNATKKSELDVYVKDVSKKEIDSHTNTKKSELDTYNVEKKTELNTHTNTKKSELDTYNATKKSELDVYTKAKESEITTHSNTEKQGITAHATGEKLSITDHANTKKSELDAYEKAKESELELFKDSKKVEITTHTNKEIDRINATGLDTKQNKTDNALETTSKDIVGAINENKRDILLRLLIGDAKIYTDAKLIEDVLEKISPTKKLTIFGITRDDTLQNTSLSFFSNMDIKKWIKSISVKRNDILETTNLEYKEIKFENNSL